MITGIHKTALSFPPFDFLSRINTIVRYACPTPRLDCSPLSACAAGKCSIRMKITDDKATMERRRFRIKVEAVGRLDIEPALTDKLTVM